ncbi:MAG: dienelactone hydrolase family protein [Acidobacteriota bacterium]
MALVISAATRAADQTPAGSKIVLIKSGTRTLRALLWQPSGRGPFPAVLFNHGSAGTADAITSSDAAALGPVFARHGYIFLFLFRQGIGLSAREGPADGVLMDRALTKGGQDGKNRVQLQLLDAESEDGFAALAFLRALPNAAAHRAALLGHSFGGAITLVMAARDPDVPAAVVFGGAAASWGPSPPLRERLLDAVGRVSAPVFFIHAANDYSTAPGKALAAEMQRLGKPNRLEVYPAFGHTQREGHNLVYRSVATWESDVFAFLDPLLKR